MASVPELLLLLLLTIALSAHAQFTYTTTNNEVTITGYTGSSGAVTIPDTINNLPVTGIRNHAFGGRPFTSVTIPNSVTSIGYSAFAYCFMLKSIEVDALNPAYCSVDGILFTKDQTSLIQFPCAKAGTYTIPNTVTSIETTAFRSCKGLTSVTIPSSVTSIGEFAFYNCSQLTSIALPGSLTTIKGAAFAACANLKAIDVDALNPAYCSSEGILFSKDQTTLVQVPAGKTGVYKIPNSVITVGGFAFYACGGLTRITIPNSVTAINIGAFESCKGLTSITIPNSVTSIYSGAFLSCTNLTTAIIGSNVSSIGSSAFYDCSSLTKAVFLGNPPSGGTFDSAPSYCKVYYFSDKTGFTSPTWNGYQSVNMGNSSPIPPWLLSKGLPHDANPQSTPNSDGVNLLMAYALNLDPTRNQSGSLPQPVIVDNQISLTYFAGSEGVTYSVEASTDLQNWSTEEVSVSAPDADQLQTASVPLSGPRRFLRLVVSQ